MARLPTPGGDSGTWGDILNDFLSQSLNSDGTLKDIEQSRINNLVTDLADKVSRSTLDANSILKADSDNTPVALTVAASRLVGRKSSGGIAALAPAEAIEIIRTSLPVELGVAVSDEVTSLTAGTAKVSFRMPYSMTLTSVRASLTTASSSGNVAIDINKNANSIFSTTLTIDSNEKTSTSAATPAVISDATLTDDVEITIDIDTAGTGAKGLKIWLIGTRA